MQGTRAVVQRYLKALEAGDLSAVTASFAEDMVMLCPDERIVGREAFRAACEQMFGGILAPGTYTRTVHEFVTQGDLALIVWSATCLGTTIPFGVTTFVVRDGLIARVTATYQVISD